MKATISTSPLAASCAIAVSSPAESNRGMNRPPCSRSAEWSDLSEIGAILLQIGRNFRR
jgi:hypothetical protein